MRIYHIKDEILWHKPLCDLWRVQLVGVGEVCTMTFVAALIEFHCDICGNNFKSVRNLKTHTTAKHQLLKSSSTDFAKSVETNWMWLALWKCNQLPNTNFSNYHSFPCDKCGIIFNLVCTLKMHTANFVCSRCHLKPYAEKLENQMGPKAKQFASKLMAVDKLHFRLAFFYSVVQLFQICIRGHKGKYCQDYCDPWKLKELDGVNTPVCEQVVLSYQQNSLWTHFPRRLRGWIASHSAAGWMRPGFSGDCLHHIHMFVIHLSRWLQWPFAGSSCTWLTFATMQKKRDCVFYVVIWYSYHDFQFGLNLWLYNLFLFLFTQTHLVRREKSFAIQCPRSFSPITTPLGSKWPPSIQLSPSSSWGTALSLVLTVPRCTNS